MPVLIAIQGVLIVGIGLVGATLNVFYRDVQHAVTVALMLFFYVTPVFYHPPVGNVDVHPRWQVGHTESSPPGHRAGTS